MPRKKNTLNSSRFQLPGALVVLVSLASACGGNQDVSGKLRGSDSLVINFYAPGSETVTESMTTTEEAAIRRLTEFISAKETEVFKCGYDGNLLFFEKGKPVSDVSFKFSDESCRHFVMDIKGQLVATKMSNQAADFLADLKTR